MQIIKSQIKLPRFWLQVAALILCIVPIAYMFGKTESCPEYLPAIVFVFLAVAAEVALFIFPGKKFSGFIALGCVIFLALSLCYFMCGGVLSVVDYIYGIKLFGDSTQFGAIVGYSVVLGLAVISGIVCCFFVKEQAEQIK